MLKDLEKPIEYLKGVGEKRAECYEKLGVKTVYDLLCHYPRSYIDYTSPVPIADAPINEPCIVKGRVVKKLPEAHIRKGLSVYKVIFTDDVTDDACGFFVRTVMVVGKLVLRKKNTPVNRLKAIARIRDGAPDNDRRGILQIRFAEFCFNADLRLLHICHCGPRCCYLGAGRANPS